MTRVPADIQYRILVIDAESSRQDAIRRSLAGAGDRPDAFAVNAVGDGGEGLRAINAASDESRPFSVAFVDMPLPPTQRDIEVILGLWEADPDLQIVVCTASCGHSWDDVVERLGRTDQLLLLRQPFADAEVWQMAAALSEKRHQTLCARQKMSELERSVERRTNALRHTNETLHREVAERRAAEDRLRHHAYHDALTGLPNRGLLIDRIDRCISRLHREEGYQFALLFLDVDNFKVINDSLGHDLGDELLIAITTRLQRGLRTMDYMARQQENLAARLGGDEFVILIDGLEHATDAVMVAERLLSQLEMPFDLGGHDVVISASIGLALSDERYRQAEEVLRDADIAMYRSKENGKARFTVFDPEMHARALERLKLESDLRHAVENGELWLAYQPIIQLSTGNIRGFEALVRWQHPERGLVSPGDFIPIAEETGLILPLGWWVLREASEQLRAWIDAGVVEPGFAINVNVSRRQLLEPGLVEHVRRCLTENGLDGSQLNLEITESAVIENADDAARHLEQVKALGVRIQMDDFGTGYSSLSCLHRFPLDVVKIDRAFMATMGANRDYAAVVHGIITIAHNLDMMVTAEGVESRDQLAQILALDCDFAQGFLFSRPVVAEEAGRMMKARTQWRMSA